MAEDNYLDRARALLAEKPREEERPDDGEYPEWFVVTDDLTGNPEGYALSTVDKPVSQLDLRRLSKAEAKRLQMLMPFKTDDALLRFVARALTEREFVEEALDNQEGVQEWLDA